MKVIFLLLHKSYILFLFERLFEATKERVEDLCLYFSAQGHWSISESMTDMQ